MVLKQVPLPTPLPLFYVGPDLTEGPLPCFIYLALSAEEALLVHPFNQPASLLQNKQVRIISVDLPYHGQNLPAIEALASWAECYEKGEDILSIFLKKLEDSLRLFFEYTSPPEIAIGGLSRGGFIASHIAAKMPNITSLLLLAPLTRLDFVKEFSSLRDSPLIKPLALSHITESLSSKKIRIYIGNRDLRVSTDFCYAFTRSLVEEAFLQKTRSPEIELYIKPSIGQFGHGTSTESFQEGTDWIAKKLRVSP